MNRANAAREFLEELTHAAGQDLSRSMLPRPDHAAHVGVTGIEHDQEIWMVHLFVHGDHFRWFVEDEPWFELPGEAHAAIARDGCRIMPGSGQTVERLLIVGIP